MFDFIANFVETYYNALLGQFFNPVPERGDDIERV